MANTTKNKAKKGNKLRTNICSSFYKGLISLGHKGLSQMVRKKPNDH